MWETRVNLFSWLWHPISIRCGRLATQRFVSSCWASDMRKLMSVQLYSSGMHRRYERLIHNMTKFWKLDTLRIALVRGNLHGGSCRFWLSLTYLAQLQWKDHCCLMKLSYWRYVAWGCLPNLHDAFRYGPCASNPPCFKACSIMQPLRIETARNDNWCRSVAHIHLWQMLTPQVLVFAKLILMPLMRHIYTEKSKQDGRLWLNVRGTLRSCSSGTELNRQVCLKLKGLLEERLDYVAEAIHNEHVLLWNTF